MCVYVYMCMYVYVCYYKHSPRSLKHGADAGLPSMPRARVKPNLTLLYLSGCDRGHADALHGLGLRVRGTVITRQKTRSVFSPSSYRPLSVRLRPRPCCQIDLSRVMPILHGAPLTMSGGVNM